MTRKLTKSLYVRISPTDDYLLEALGRNLLNSLRFSADEKRKLTALDGSVSHAAVMRYCLHFLAARSGVQAYKQGFGTIAYDGKSEMNAHDLETVKKALLSKSKI